MINEQQRLFLHSLLEEQPLQSLGKEQALNQLSELVNIKMGQGISFHLAAHQALNELIVQEQEQVKTVSTGRPKLFLALAAVLLALSLFTGYSYWKSQQQKQVPTLFPIADQEVAFFSGEITNNTLSGIDISAVANSPVTATGSGEIIMIETNPQTGTSIVIRHNDVFKTVYGHLSKVLVKEGDIVKQGSQIGFSGLSPMTQTGTLHYAIIEEEQFIDPVQFMRSAITHQRPSL